MIFLGAVFLLIVVLFFHTREDARRWIPLGFTTFQPSELAKFAIVLIFAHLISINYDKMKDLSLIHIFDRIKMAIRNVKDDAAQD